MIDREKWAEVRRLFYGQHWKVGTIADQLGIHHETVSRAIDTDRFVSNSLVRPSALDPFIEVVIATFERYPKLTAKRVHEMLKARGYKGSVGQLRRRIRQLGLRPEALHEAFFRLTTAPGEQGQIDWGHFGKIRIGHAERPLYLFVVVLSWSRAVHVDFSLDQTMAAVMRGHVRAFETFGGIPRQVLYDNMKTVVIERMGNAIHFHARLLDLAGHYHFEPRPCRPRRGNEKGHVERYIRYLRTSFFAGREFVDLADLRRQFRAWRDEIAYVRPCPGDPTITVAQALERERPLLLPLPQHPIDTDDVRAACAAKQPYLRYDRNLYSIPYTLVGKPLTIATSDTVVRVLHGVDEVARHVRSWDAHQTIENPAHLEGLLESKRAARGTTGRERLIAAVPSAEALYVELVQRQTSLPRETRELLRLLDEFGAKPLAAAIDEAMRRETPRASSVARLLDQTLRAQGHKPTLPLRLPERPGVADLTVRNHNLEDYDDINAK